jgi:hypothetical protein
MTYPRTTCASTARSEAVAQAAILASSGNSQLKQARHRRLGPLETVSMPTSSRWVTRRVTTSYWLSTIIQDTDSCSTSQQSRLQIALDPWPSLSDTTDATATAFASSVVIQTSHSSRRQTYLKTSSEASKCDMPTQRNMKESSRTSTRLSKVTPYASRNNCRTNYTTTVPQICVCICRRSP